jgi:hypothetical protein
MGQNKKMWFYENPGSFYFFSPLIMVVIMGFCIMFTMVMFMSISHRSMGVLRVFGVCVLMGVNMKMRMGMSGALMGMFMIMFVNVLVAVQVCMFVMMMLVHGCLLYIINLSFPDHLKFTVISAEGKSS